MRVLKGVLSIFCMGPTSHPHAIRGGRTPPSPCAKNFGSGGDPDRGVYNTCVQARRGDLAVRLGLEVGGVGTGRSLAGVHRHGEGWQRAVQADLWGGDQPSFPFPITLDSPFQPFVRTVKKLSDRCAGCRGGGVRSTFLPIFSTRSTFGQKGTYFACCVHI